MGGADAANASRYGKVRAALERKGQPTGPNDTRIAAHAPSPGLVVVSDTVRQSKRVRELEIESRRED
jgi:predicted nucleic acid-binding protein